MIPKEIYILSTLLLFFVAGALFWGIIEDNSGKQFKQKKKNDIELVVEVKRKNCWVRRKAKITAYVPITERHGKYNDGKTAVGDDATKLDGVAVDPERIPYRSKVYIPGVGMREADDTGAAMRNSDELLIDLRVKNTKIAREWGVKHKYVFISK